MTDVTMDQDLHGAVLPEADEQLLRELTERARAGGRGTLAGGAVFRQATGRGTRWQAGVVTLAG